MLAQNQPLTAESFNFLNHLEWAAGSLLPFHVHLHISPTTGDPAKTPLCSPITNNKGPQNNHPLPKRDFSTHKHLSEKLQIRRRPRHREQMKQLVRVQSVFSWKEERSEKWQFAILY